MTLVFVLVLGLMLQIPILETAVRASGATTQESSQTDNTILLDPAAESRLEINGKAYVLYDAQSGEFLIGKNSDTRLSPASITKVMTVLLALENLSMTDTITIRKEMFSTIPNDYVRLGLFEGEEITVEQALYATLLISANDAATALALTMSESIEAFSAMMNERAAELGCTGTNFTNPYGFADPENLTTAHDMALILAAALEHEAYTNMSTTLQYLMPATNKYGTRGFTNNNRFVCTELYRYEPYIGGKTGFTNLSGQTIVAGAQKDGRTLIGVILGSTVSETRYANLKTLFDYGFDMFSTTPVNAADYEPIKRQAIDDLQTELKNAGLNLEVQDSAMTLDPYVTTTKARDKGGYSSRLGARESTPQALLARQVIDYPLFRDYSDGTKKQVGTLHVTLVKTQPPAPVGTKPSSEGDSGESSLPLVVRIAIVVLAALLILGIALVILLRYEMRRRRRRYHRVRVKRPF